MIVSEIKLYNFRRFHSENGKPGLFISFHKGMNAIIGENDAGKTAVIDAIKLVFLTQSNDLCTEWRVENFEYYADFHKWTRDCVVDNIAQDVDRTTCSALEIYCWDGSVDDWEECDPEDPTEYNWWNDWCSSTCQKVSVSSDECDETFHRVLRHNEGYIFHDTFNNPGSKTRYLYDYNVKFLEKNPYDYNRWTDPQFYRAESLTNGVYIKVPKWTSKKVLESSPIYRVLDHPNVRSENDLYIEYEIKYAEKEYSSKPDDSKLKTHRECVYYGISR